MRSHLRPLVLTLLALSAAPVAAQTPTAKPSAQPAKAQPTLVLKPTAAPKTTGSAAPTAAPKTSGSAAPTAAPTGAPTTAPSTTSSAKPPSDIGSEDAAMTEKARELFKEGNKHYRAEKWAQAEAAYEAAWALTDKKSKGLVNNLGQTEMRLGKHREAAEHLSMALRLSSPEDKQRPDIERDFAEAKKKVGTLVVTSNVEGAQVMLADKPVGTAPLTDPVFVDPGKVSLTAFKDGYSSAKADLDVQAGQEVPVPLTLNKAAPVSTSTATAKPTATAPPPVRERSMTPVYVMGGIGAGMVVLGGLFLGIGLADAEGVRQNAPKDANGQPLCGQTPAPGAAPGGICDDMRATAAAAKGATAASVPFFVIGGLLGAGALSYYLFGVRPSRAKPTATLVPVVSPEGGGLQWTGSF